MTTIAELIGRHVPTVIVPFVNTALATRLPFRRAVASLRDEGLHIMLGPDTAGNRTRPAVATTGCIPLDNGFEIAARMLPNRFDLGTSGIDASPPAQSV